MDADGQKSIDAVDVVDSSVEDMDKNEVFEVVLQVSY